jgi:voltage-gated potassium channel Kch
MLSLNQKINSRLKVAFLWGISLLVISFGAALLLLHFEMTAGNTSFQTLGDLYWWWLETITGLGSSSSPITAVGQVIATFIIIAGFVLLGLFISEFSAIVRMIYTRREEGNIRINYRGHIAVFGYSSLTAGIIKLLRKHYQNGVRILLISNETKVNPFPDQVDFLHANPISKKTLLDANIANATAVIITASDHFRDPDTYSLVIAAGISQLNSSVITIAEISDDKYKELFKRTNIDGFIEREEMLSDLLDGNPQPKLLRIINKQTGLSDNMRPASDTASTPGELL